VFNQTTVKSFDWSQSHDRPRTQQQYFNVKGTQNVQSLCFMQDLRTCLF